jgi:hypothetical protein
MLTTNGDKLILQYENNIYELYNMFGVNKQKRAENKNYREIIKLDDRFLMCFKIRYPPIVLYPYSHVMKTKEVQDEIRSPLSCFVGNYIHNNNDIEFCKRCYIGIFAYLHEDNHGGLNYDCDTEECHKPIFQEHNIKCQRCDYRLCDSCEENKFDTQNFEYNVILTAVVLSARHNCDDILFILEEFPHDGNKYAARMMLHIYKYLNGEFTSKSHRDIWTFSDANNLKKLMDTLENY